MLKICARCKLEKEETGFTKSSNRKDGLSVYCKICKSLEAKKYNKENREKCAEKLRIWREKNPEKSKEYSKTDREKNRELIIARRRTPESRKKIYEIVKKWQSKNIERVRENRRDWKRKNRDQENAKSQIAKALRKGKMLRPDMCENCKIKCKPEGHHFDYSKPLEVQWLCFVCHKQIHGKLKDHYA